MAIIHMAQRSKDFALEVSKGKIPGHGVTHKFGSTSNADSGVVTDIWDRANVPQNQAVWIAPTEARIHNLVSTSVNDAAGGSGGLNVFITGLTDWDLPPDGELVALNGTTPAPTTKSWVIVHRMLVLNSGGTFMNEGTITCTAAVDGTVTAQIEPGNGQTQMAILGIPSTHTFHVTNFFSHIALGSPSGSGAAIIGRLNTEPQTQLTQFRLVRELSMRDAGTSAIGMPIGPPGPIAGPAIIKLQAISDAADTLIVAGFDGYIVENGQ
jgi:hypothetical protein